MKFLFSVLFVFAAFAVFGQTIDDKNHFSNKGKILIEAGYGRLLAIADIGPGYGIDGGYFILENFAIKFKTGIYTLGINNNEFFYGMGFKYFFAGRVPLEINYEKLVDAYLTEYSIGYLVSKKAKVYLEPSISLVLGEIDSYIKPAIKLTFIL